MINIDIFCLIKYNLISMGKSASYKSVNLLKKKKKSSVIIKKNWSYINSNI